MYKACVEISGMILHKLEYHSNVRFCNQILDQVRGLDGESSFMIKWSLPLDRDAVIFELQTEDHTIYQGFLRIIMPISMGVLP